MSAQQTGGYTLCVLGCGTMGVAVLSGVLDSLEQTRRRMQGAASEDGDESDALANSMTLEPSDRALPSSFIATVNRTESARKLKRTFADPADAQSSRVSVRLSAENVKSVQEADVVLLCCKPQMAKALLSVDGMTEALKGKLLISILAGTTIKMLQDMVPSDCTVVRAMPNTPTKIREGMTVLSTLAPTSPSHDRHRAIVLSLFTPIGKCRFLDEKHFDAVTAVCGSGPAFVCLVLEAMADGGVMMGLPRAEALELAAQTMQGASRMVMQTGMHPAQIKDTVTTPGGCTIAGLLALEDGRVRGTISRCIQATTLHAAGLGGPADRK